LLYFTAPIPIRRTKETASSRHRINNFTSQQLVSYLKTERPFLTKAIHTQCVPEVHVVLLDEMYCLTYIYTLFWKKMMEYVARF